MIETGLIYRNPKPHLYSRQAAFPSLALLPSGEMLASFAIGSGFEAADQHTELAQSSDGCRTWQLAGAVFNERTDRPTSANVRISRMPDGELIAFGVRADRSRADEGLTNPETQGFVETELIMLRSSDDGHTWQGPAIVEPPLVGPSFELCSPVVPLRDGRWLWPTSTWKGWDGECPAGMKAIALVSHDRGQTWTEYVDVMDGTAEDVIYWEQKIVDMGDGRLLAVCWTHDLAEGADREVHYAISEDYGRSFGPPRRTGLHGQTSTPIYLGDGRLVCIYRRTDRPGLWAAYARIDGGQWVSDAQLPLWGHDRAGAANIVGGENLSREFTTLKFGLPAGLPLPDGQIYVAFWCVEECIYNIRWFRIPGQPADDSQL
jgi:BNR repeat protein